METNEVWKNINDEKFYQVSNLGNVRSVDKTICVHGVKYVKKGRVLIQSVSKRGYLTIGLIVCNKQKTCLVHRLIAKAFIENPLKKDTVNHIDGNKLNNNVKNLEWNTLQENITHSHVTGLITSSGRKVPVTVYDKLTGKYMDFPSVSTCSIKIGVAASGVFTSFIRGNIIRKRFRIVKYKTMNHTDDHVILKREEKKARRRKGHEKYKERKPQHKQ